MSYNSIYNIVGFNNEVNRLETQAKLGWKKEFRTLKWLGLKDGMRILDVGSGTGVYTELLLENLPHSSVTALEVDRKLFDMYKVKYKEFKSGVNGIGYSIFAVSPGFYFFLVKIMGK